MKVNLIKLLLILGIIGLTLQDKIKGQYKYGTIVLLAVLLYFTC